jgi:putative chitinase
MLPLISTEALRRFAPACPADQIAPCLDTAARRFGIDTPREIRHWMATCSVESAGFLRLEENLNYSAPRLVAVWPRRFPTLAAAQPFAHNPRALANRVYAGRMGNTGPDDGWRHRGSGPGQLTGKDNFARAGKAVGADLIANPDLARTWRFGALVAAWFWQDKGLSGIVGADPGERIYATLAQTISENEFDDVRDARHVWNGGENGLAEVRAALLRAAVIWPDTAAR